MGTPDGDGKEIVGPGQIDGGSEPENESEPDSGQELCIPYACQQAGLCPMDRAVKMDLRTIKHELANKLGPTQYALNSIRKRIEQDPDKYGPDMLKMIEMADQGLVHIWGLMDQIRRRIDSVVPANVANPKENPDFSDVDFSEAVNAEVDFWCRLLQMDDNIKKHIRPGILILGEIIKVQEILTNIFKNAIEVMKNKEKKECLLHVRLITINDALQLTVQDNGPGIMPEYKDKLFRKGFSSKGGDGIGLYHSRKLARQMGGDLWLIDNHEREALKAANNIDNAELKGATAILELPISIINVA